MNSLYMTTPRSDMDVVPYVITLPRSGHGRGGVDMGAVHRGLLNAHFIERVVDQMVHDGLENQIVAPSYDGFCETHTYAVSPSFPEVDVPYITVAYFDGHWTTWNIDGYKSKIYDEYVRRGVHGGAAAAKQPQCK